MSHCAAIGIEKFDRVPQMLRRLSMECRRRCMMLCSRQLTFNGASRRWSARMLGSDMNLVDGMLGVAVRQHCQIGSMLVILGRLVILRGLPMKQRCLLVMRCRCLEMPYFARLGGHDS